MTKPELSPSLSEEIKADLAVKISDTYKSFDNKRSKQLTDIKTIKDAIYANNDPSEGWSANIKLPEIYELAQTLKSHFWENIYSNPDGMFDVVACNKESLKHIEKQKAMLVNAFEEMKVSNALDEAVTTLIETGECILFVGWDKKTKNKRTQCLDAEGKQEFMIEEKEIFNGPLVKNIMPDKFVFDTTVEFEKACKICKTDATISEILSNSMFTVSEEDKLVLEGLISEEDDGEKSNKIELLEFWGDFTTADGKEYKNYLVVVAGDTVILRFEPNPYVIDPFVCFSLIENPENKRGISPLQVAVSLNNVSSVILNKQLDALNLILNPPYLAPKGCFSGIQDVSPGKIIEYEATLMPTTPTPLKFDTAMKGWEFLNYFKNTIESSTGVFKNSMLSGLQPRSATEVSYAASAQSTRLAMSIDLINQKMIVPMVEKVADLLANFSFGNQTIAVETKGQQTFLEIDEETRNGEYKYRYGDRKATLERKLQYKELSNTISSFAKMGNLEAKINWIECFKYSLEQFGIENSQRFLLSNPEAENNVVTPQKAKNDDSKNEGVKTPSVPEKEASSTQADIDVLEKLKELGNLAKKN